MNDTPHAMRMPEDGMPLRANKVFKAEPKLFARADGMYFMDKRGRQILDGSSAHFTSAAGHCRPEIAIAVYRALNAPDYAPTLVRGHRQAFELAQRIGELAPPGIDRVLLCGSDAEAVDTAMSACLAFHRARREGQRTLFVSRERANHGFNCRGVAHSGIAHTRSPFGNRGCEVVHMRHTWLPENRFVKGEPEHGAELAEDLQRIVTLHGADNIAACLVEPVAGPAGVLVPPKDYLKRLRELCDQHGILLVFDEAVCALGRTGKAFAAQSFNVTPDIITLGRALANGAQPIGAVAFKQAIYDAILSAAHADGIERFNDDTHSAHPAACAAALATLDIYEQEHLIERGAANSSHFLDAVFGLSDLPVISDIRGHGMLAGIDFMPDQVPGRRGHEIQKRLYKAGVQVTPTEDAVILAPALIAERRHIDDMCTILRKVLASYVGHG